MRSADKVGGEPYAAGRRVPRVSESGRGYAALSEIALPALDQIAALAVRQAG